ncbi:hypothetical protein [Halapricum hydrolyticum]|uniref:Uncharacterized protein n=1 Tax=Halapricum hydrolyticum TaxID=2979991 RepID=A0AAE3LEB7_9EURY|nr:hypothetical protein [Halapricum hydrolyticum]MCU4716605.1 hypothetical protein [Halapricum hydrolyticum]MCU4725790.1 hypothetical protein [Halapricum hydrolyticum]
MSTTISESVADRLTSKYIPCVRYGFPKESKHTRQHPRLIPITEPIPDEAITVSPIYLLTQSQYQRQAALDNPYAVSGALDIAKLLQDECEADDRVIHPLYVESDKYRKRGPDALLEWLRTFTEEVLEMDPASGTYFHSGSRSIHLHVPRFLLGEPDWKPIKAQIEAFTEQTDAEFDLAIYGAKRLFRLPGVIHSTTGFPKVKIGPYWSEEQIIDALTGENPPVPETYADVLATVFGHPPKPEVPTPAGTPQPLEDILARLGGPDNVARLGENNARTATDSETTIETLPIEQQTEPVSETEHKRWCAYNQKEFSPYAKTGNGERSVAVVQPIGGTFARKTVRNGAALVPAYFFGGIGGDGDFEKYRTFAPLQLSERDRKKWDPDAKYVVVIGGRSRASHIISVDEKTAKHLGDVLHSEDGGRQEARAHLEKQGYDTGSAGQASTRPSKPAGTQDYDRVLPATHPRTDAGRFQQRAEEEGIQTLTHDERFRVACRLLYKYPWDPVWDWFKTQYADDFDPDVTWTQLNSAAQTISVDVTVPARP